MIKLRAIGHLGKDVVINNINGKNVLNFTVAHTEKYRDNQGNNHEKTTWLDCSWWTDSTAIANYLKKGKQVYVEGTPEARAFTRQDGSAGSSFSVRVREVQLLGGSASNAGGSGAAPSTAPANSDNNYVNANDIIEPIDDLPF